MLRSITTCFPAGLACAPILPPANGYGIVHNERDADGRNPKLGVFVGMLFHADTIWYLAAFEGGRFLTECRRRPAAKSTAPFPRS